jgi:hypothetical protein
VGFLFAAWFHNNKFGYFKAVSLNLTSGIGDEKYHSFETTIVETKT